MEGAEPPELAWLMVMTKVVNQFLNTSYTLDEIATWPPLAFDIMGWVQKGLNPNKRTETMD